MCKQHKARYFILHFFELTQNMFLKVTKSKEEFGSPEDVLNASSLSEEGIDHWCVAGDHGSLEQVAEEREDRMEPLKLTTLYRGEREDEREREREGRKKRREITERGERRKKKE